MMKGILAWLDYMQWSVLDNVCHRGRVNLIMKYVAVSFLSVGSQFGRA